jgi:hypothetical protein
MRYRHLAILGLSAITAAAWSHRSFAQYELGGGDALDANTGSGYGRTNLPSARPAFGTRNLVVTGNVASGRGFRGTVGYTAAYDFRGQLGSDDLFRERAYGALSSPTFLNAGRTLERLRFGQHLGQIEYRRAGQGASPQGLGEQRVMPGAMIDERITLDHLAISSTTSAVYEAKADARVFGLLQDQEGRRVVASASSLFGVQLTPFEQQAQLFGLTSYDMARSMEDMQSGRGTSRPGDPFTFGFEDLAGAETPGSEPPTVTGRVEAEMAQLRIEPAQEASYRGILERIEQRYAALRPAEAEGGLSLLLDLDEQFEALRRQMEKPGLPQAREPAATDAADEKLPGSATEIPGSAGADRLAAPLRHGARLDRLAAGDQTRFQELLASAGQMLRDGEYFWAERRFERALRFTPGHPLATAGMGHAQIGAGLYAPAALTLRRLLTDRPEMIDVQYGPDVLPGRVRLNIAVDRLRELLAESRDRALHAFLLAYIGHQLERRDLVEEGLRVMGEESPQDPLQTLLQKIWLEEDEAPAP